MFFHLQKHRLLLETLTFLVTVETRGLDIKNVEGLGVGSLVTA